MIAEAGGMLVGRARLNIGGIRTKNNNGLEDLTKDQIVCANQNSKLSNKYCHHLLYRIQNSTT